MTYATYPSIPTFGLFYSGNLLYESLKQIIIQARAKNSSFTVMAHPGKKELLSEPAAYSLNYRLAWQEEYEMLRSRELKNWLVTNDIVLDTFK
jgi:predicted glycoside hydrolase/deacetylase ChbG (UPF0249 family)